MGPGSTPWHKTRPPAGRWAVCTEPHQCTRASRDLRAGAARSGVDGGSSVARALPQVRKPTRVRLAAFLAVLDGRKTRRAEKIFFSQKNGHMANLASRRAQQWAIFFFPWYQNLPPGKVTGKWSETRARIIFTTFGPSEVQIW